MDFTRQPQSGSPMPSRQPLDFVAPKKSDQKSQKTKIPDLVSKLTPKSPTELATQAPKSNQKPVTSAKAAINAMLTAQANQQPTIVASAREAVNAAAQQAGVQHTKSAANLHHGSIQRSMESTRTSASALLRRAGEKDEIPVVRTSLKLGASARPKPAPVVLPPGARMAKVARPVEGAVQTPKSGKIAKFLRLGAADVGAASASGINPASPAKVLSSGQTNLPAQDNTLSVNVISSDSVSHQKRKVSAVRDPQMLAGARRSMQSRAQNLAKTGAMVGKAQNLAGRAQAAEVLGMATTGTSRFRLKPKGFSTNQPSALPTDNSYIMAEPPKLSAKKKPPVPENLAPAVVGDRVPTGNIQAQKIASGHVDAPDLPAIKSENTSNYSFNRRKSEPDNNRYVLGGESPFLKSVNVEKRPLSDNPQKFNPSVSRPAAPRAPEPAKSNSKPKQSGRKNQYAKKSAPAPSNLPVRPTVIIPSSHRSNAPLCFLIVITVVLGAAVGAAAYFCFYQ